jgi:hypothetical protein
MTMLANAPRRISGSTSRRSKRIAAGLHEKFGTRHAREIVEEVDRIEYYQLKGKIRSRRER